MQLMCGILQTSHTKNVLQNKITLVNQTNSAVWLLGGFNLPKIDWEILIPSPECGHPTFYRDCLEALDDCLLEQMVTSPTRGQISKICSSQLPLPSWTMYLLPQVSLTMTLVLIQVNVKQVPRNIYLYK